MNSKMKIKTNKKVNKIDKIEKEVEKTLEVLPKASINLLNLAFGREDLNELRDKLNEVIVFLNNS